MREQGVVHPLQWPVSGPGDQGRDQKKQDLQELLHGEGRESAARIGCGRLRNWQKIAFRSVSAARARGIIAGRATGPFLSLAGP
jgi:hypothetical protein